MKTNTSLKNLSVKTLQTQLKAIKAHEARLLTELDDRLYDRQVKLKAKVKGLTGLDRTVALFKPITAKQALTTINSVRGLKAKDAAKVSNLRFFHLLTLNSEKEIRYDFRTKAPQIFAQSADGRVYRYGEEDYNGRLFYLGRAAV